MDLVQLWSNSQRDTQAVRFSIREKNTEKKNNILSQKA